MRGAAGANASPEADGAELTCTRGVARRHGGAAGGCRHRNSNSGRRRGTAVGNRRHAVVRRCGVAELLPGTAGVEATPLTEGVWVLPGAAGMLVLEGTELLAGTAGVAAASEAEGAEQLPNVAGLPSLFEGTELLPGSAGAETVP